MQDDGADLWAGNGRCMVGGASIVGVNTLLARRWCGGKISNGATGCMCIQEVHCWRNDRDTLTDRDTHIAHRPLNAWASHNSCWQGW